MCALWLWAGLVWPSQARADVGEYELKTAFVYNFALFTDWPSQAGAGPLTLCVLGDGRFGGALDGLHEKTVRGRALQVRRAPASDELRRCHILFVTASEKLALPRLVGELAGLPVLVVAETDGALAMGAAINLIWDKSRIVFEVNSAALTLAQLTVSSKLLRLAREVR